MAAWMTAVVHASGMSTVLPERFSNMTPGQAIRGWRPMNFEKIDRHTRYTLVEDDGRTVLQADSQSAASGLVQQMDLDPTAWPVLSWQWKVNRTLDKGDVARKSGDDYAARIYITFNEPVETLSFFQRSKLVAIRMLYGQAPPSAALTYIWGNRATVGSIHPNPYTDRVRMIVVDSGPAHVDQWRSAQRNIVEDFKRAFGTDPPRISAIAVMTDTDNTGESATAWYGDIVFSHQSKE
jgi:hypothetical protein